MPHNPRLRRPWFDVSFIIITFIGIGIIIPLNLYYPWLVLYFKEPALSQISRFVTTRNLMELRTQFYIFLQSLRLLVLGAICPGIVR